VRIGFVLSSTPGYSETFFRSKIRGLIEAGHEVMIFAARKDKDFNLCPVIYAPRIYKSFFLRLLAATINVLFLLLTRPSRILLFYKAEKSSGNSLKQILEHIYINSHILSTQQLHWLHFGFATMAVRRENVALAIGAKMGVSLRGYDISLYPLKHPGCYNLLWKRVNKIHVISNELVQVAFNHGMPPGKSVVKITPAINVQKFQRDTPFNDLVTPLRILTVARLKWKKGIEYTFHALALLKESGIAFNYTLIGDGEEYERLVFTATQLGISDSVTFAGKKSHEEVKRAMENADLYLQYSIQEGFCNAVLEAQAMGLLCVVSDAEGLSENVLNNQTGWIVPKRNSRFFAEKIIEIMQKSPTDLYKIRTMATDRVQKEFNLEKQQVAFNDFFTK